VAKETPKSVKLAGKVDQPKAKKPAAPNATAKPKKRPAKTTGPAARAAAAKGVSKPAQAAAKPASKSAKKAPAAKSPRGRARKVSQGDQMYCDTCGLVVTVDETCGCAACDIICCGAQMQAR
jgi:hypothetical protein